MALYVGLTIWFFLLLLMGLRPDSIDAAQCWPNQPEDKVARINKIIVSILVLLTFLLLWFLSAFRSAAIGNDTSNYLYYFNIFSKGIDRSRDFEIGFQCLNYLISRVTLDQHAFLIIIATIMYGGTGLYILKYSKNPAVSLCLFFGLFFSVYTNTLRQGIAMMIALYGYQFLKDGKKIPAALVFLLAMAFHTTALCCFLLFLDVKILEKWWFVLGLTALCAVISFSGVLRTVVDTLVPRYSHYFAGKYASSGWFAVSVYLLSYLVLYLMINGSINTDCKPDKIVATNFTLLLILTAFGYAVNLFERAAGYYLLIAVTEIPNMLYRGKAKHFRLWLLCICTVFLLMFLATLIFRPGWNHLYPYEFWH